MTLRRFPLPQLCASAIVVCAVSLVDRGAVSLAAQSDLDAFMARVLERRDDDWAKLQQYVLDEREQFELRGPTGAPILGERREYTWFIRDGFFVRSPLRFNGVPIAEAERRRFEARFLEREQARAKRDQERETASSGDPSRPSTGAASTTAADLGGLLDPTRQPQFISSAYFLRFRFEQGQYALVGRETVDGTNVLRIEYYPTQLFQPRPRGSVGNANSKPGRERRERETNPELAAAIQRLLNKGSRVTLWIEPSAHQIVRYTFDNIDLDFFPGQWLATVTGARASMTMGQPFPDVWLPRQLEMHVGLMLALGPLDLSYSLEYHDYRRAEVSSTLRVPDPW